jgi:hypothetical protein
MQNSILPKNLAFHALKLKIGGAVGPFGVVLLHQFGEQFQFFSDGGPLFLGPFR